MCVCVIAGVCMCEKECVCRCVCESECECVCMLGGGCFLEPPQVVLMRESEPTLRLSGPGCPLWNTEPRGGAAGDGERGQPSASSPFPSCKIKGVAWNLGLGFL